ncbi:MAG: hypothetical protein CL609_20850 [Anaerolineaceae bacterium]|nr:hypothetical protein [Anaerolineaceae bacterium]
MHVKIGIDTNYEKRAIAWALDYPGCFAYGGNDQEVLLWFPQTFIQYQLWINQKAGKDSWMKEIRDFDVRLVESFQNFQVKDYEVVSQGGETVMSWFQQDWQPLNRVEVLQGIQILNWSREDLLSLVSTLSPDQMQKEYTGERWTIAGILKHIGGAEWWYMERLGLAGMTRYALPTDPIERLSLVRERFLTVLPDLAGEEMVRGRDGELWSPRKMLRRAAWHERDHYFHIQKLLIS